MKRSKFITWVLPVAVIVLSVALSRYFAINKKLPPTHQVSMHPQKVDVQLLHASTDTISVDMTGIVTSREKVMLASEVGGHYTDVLTDWHEGIFLKKGQVIGTIHSLEYEVILKRWESQLANAQLEYELLHEKSKTQSQDWMQLQKVTTLNSEPNTWVKQEPQKEALTKQIEYLKKEVDLANFNLAKTRIEMPFDGYLIKKLVFSGAYCNRGTTVCELVAEQAIEVECLVGKLLQTLTDHIVSMRVHDTSLMYETQKPVYRGEVDTQTKLNVLTAKIKLPPNVFLPLNSVVSVTIDIKPVTSYFKIPVEAIHLNREIRTLNAGNQLVIRNVSMLHMDRKWAYIQTEHNAPFDLIVSSLNEPFAGMLLSIRNRIK